VVIPRIERTAVLTGAITSLTIGVATILAYQVVEAAADPGDDSILPILFSLVIVAGWVVGGLVAARRDSGAPLTSGALAALASVVVIAVVGSAINIASGDDVRWKYIVLFAIVAATAGIFGAVIAPLTVRRRA
jgi:putative membrane protein (TIGR04086 family)